MLSTILFDLIISDGCKPFFGLYVVFCLVRSISYPFKNCCFSGLELGHATRALCVTHVCLFTSKIYCLTIGISFHQNNDFHQFGVGPWVCFPSILHSMNHTWSNALDQKRRKMVTFSSRSTTFLQSRSFAVLNIIHAKHL